MKNRICILSILTAILLFSSPSGLAQVTAVKEDEKKEFKVRIFRIGVKIGFPNIVGGNLEYVTPLFAKKLAANAEYSSIKSDW